MPTRVEWEYPIGLICSCHEFVGGERAGVLFSVLVNQAFLTITKPNNIEKHVLSTFTLGHNDSMFQFRELRKVQGAHIVTRRQDLRRRGRKRVEHLYLETFFACVPSRNPFLNFLDIVLRYFIRPVPLVRLLFALAPQLYLRIFERG